MPPTISLRPSPTTGPLQAGFVPPTIEWLSGTWHLTHSTLSMWKSNRNVRISYAIVPAPNTQDLPNKLDDTTSYQPLTSSKFKTIKGVDTACGTDTSVWDWRGKGNVPEEAGGPGQWLVIYFTATKFTNAGISVLSRTKEGNPAAVMKEILESLADIENEAVKKLAREIFEVLRN